MTQMHIQSLASPPSFLTSLAGLSGSIALALSMGGFLAIMGYAGRRLWRMYF
jgi:hypothetical protein